MRAGPMGIIGEKSDGEYDREDRTDSGNHPDLGQADGEELAPGHAHRGEHVVVSRGDEERP